MTTELIISNDNTKTMTSLELLEVINAYRKEEFLSNSQNQKEDFVPMRHDNFIKKIEDELEGGLLNFQDTYINPQNKQIYKCYRLPEDECLQMAMRESKYVRKNVVKKIHELMQSQPQVQVPQTLPDALRLAADLAEQTQQLSKQNQQLQIANDEQQEFIEVIRDSKKTRVYKKDLCSECVKIVQRMNKLYAMPFQDIWDEAYTKLMKLHFVEWKREFYQANNKLDYLAQKHISYLKDLKDILIAMSKPDKAEVTA